MYTKEYGVCWVGHMYTKEYGVCWVGQPKEERNTKYKTFRSKSITEMMFRALATWRRVGSVVSL